MTVLELLRQHGTLRAAEIAEALGLPLEAVYGDLVGAEALGLVACRPILCDPHQRHEWEAL
jgi:DNA-binding IclR family transcriptional regulator